jgi:hypothetical protein
MAPRPRRISCNVIERFELSADGRKLEALLKLDDQDTANGPLNMT